jgi:hypothetical protein
MNGIPQRVDAHDPHEILRRRLSENRPRRDPRVREEHVEPAVCVDSLLDDFGDLGLVRGVELPRVHLDVRVQRAQLALVRREVVVVVVAHVDGARAVLRELVHRRAADA